MNYKLSPCFFGIVTIFHLFQLKKQTCCASTFYFCNFPEVDAPVICLTGWVNRFANAGDAAMEIAGNTAFRVRSSPVFLFLSLPGLYPALGLITIVNFK
jgi:hypothetical protein